MNIPGGIPQHALTSFQLVNLKRPILNRLEFLALAFANRQRHHDTIMFSTRKEIKHAIKLYADHMRVKPNYRKSMFISEAIGFITDYPHDHNGNVVGLCRKSIEFHRNNLFRNAGKHSKYKPEHPTALPPIDLPKVSGITFLSKVEDLWILGEKEGHCVGSYDSKAVRGDCFIFHAERDGETATIEINAGGRVIQARGKRNQQNKACKWGSKILSDWGKLFPVLEYKKVF